ncbi:unnamed protein product, partial [Amoebophrya sp. A25]
EKRAYLAECYWAAHGVIEKEASRSANPLLVAERKRNFFEKTAAKRRASLTMTHPARGMFTSKDDLLPEADGDKDLVQPRGQFRRANTVGEYYNLSTTASLGVDVGSMTLPPASTKSGIAGRRFSASESRRATMEDVGGGGSSASLATSSQQHGGSSSSRDKTAFGTNLMLPVRLVDE